MTERIDPSLIPPEPDLTFETALWRAKVRYVVGIDEAGRGAIAGPVAAGAVLFPPDKRVAQQLVGVRDSKELSASQREELKERIQEAALAWAVAYASPSEIDKFGIVPAIRLAAQRALDRILPTPEHLLLDYLQLPENPTPQTWLVKGDARSLSIAAASILTKTTRDAHLEQLGDDYPAYQLASNKGYGTQAHRDRIRETGPSPIHRMTFAPMRNLIQG